MSQKRTWIIAHETNGHIQVVERKISGSWVYVTGFEKHEVEEARKWVRDEVRDPKCPPTQVIDLTTQFFDLDVSGRSYNDDASVVKW